MAPFAEAWAKGGGAEGNRTPDLRIANATLSQLSYGPGSSAGLGLRRRGGYWDRAGLAVKARRGPAGGLPEKARSFERQGGKLGWLRFF